METESISNFNKDINDEIKVSKHEKLYPSLDNETRTAIPTDAAAFHLSRASQTLRTWACFENGPIKPVRINGRLSWRVSDLVSLLGGSK